MAAVSVDFCGEWFRIEQEDTFTIGRDADLEVDDNPFLHRKFLQITFSDSMWWLVNVGSRLSATVTDDAGGMQAWLAPGARLPLVFKVTNVIFTAGPTTYELAIHTDQATFDSFSPTGADAGATTVGPVHLTSSQKMLILALAEPMLSREGTGISAVPTSSQAAQRLGWAMTKFNRKLDNVCDKLDRMGVRGLRGGPGKLASNRRARLVEHAVSSRLVTADDLAMLDTAHAED